MRNDREEIKVNKIEYRKCYNSSWIYEIFELKIEFCFE